MIHPNHTKKLSPFCDLVIFLCFSSFSPSGNPEVYQIGIQVIEEEGCHCVQEGMLFQEHGGQADQAA